MQVRQEPQPCHPRTPTIGISMSQLGFPCAISPALQARAWLQVTPLCTKARTLGPHSLPCPAPCTAPHNFWQKPQSMVYKVLVQEVQPVLFKCTATQPYLSGAMRRTHRGLELFTRCTSKTSAAQKQVHWGASSPGSLTCPVPCAAPRRL